MSDEDAFLRAILSNPKDDAPRLVYADWLDERGDEHSSRKAHFLRLTARHLTARSRIERRHWDTKLRFAARNLDPDWLTVVSKLPIEKCAVRFEFRCPKRWENLRATDDPNVRDCVACGKPVYHSNTIAEAKEHARRGDCVALSLLVKRSPGDLDRSVLQFAQEDLVMLGRLRTRETEVVVPPVIEAVQQPAPSQHAPPDHRSDRIRSRRPRRERRRNRLTSDED